MIALPRLLSRHAFFLVLAAAGVCATPAFGQDGAAPPLEAFFSRPQLDDVTLSPSGRYLAAISAAPGQRDRLMVIDLQVNKARLVAGTGAGAGEVDIVELAWVNDQRLLFKVFDRDTTYPFRTPRGLYAVNRDGSGLRQLSERGWSNQEASQIAARLLPSRTAMLGQGGAQDTDEAYVTIVRYDDRDEPPTTDLLRLDTVTGKTRKVVPPDKAGRWLLDHAGEPRLTVYSARGKTRIHYLDPATGKWRLLTEFAHQPGNKDAITPLAFGPDGTLYVRSYAGQDTAALYTFDLASGKLGAKPLVVMPGYDFDGSLIFRQGKH